ncbi:MAG TPA: glycosyltransferase [Stellaceae bacterium]|nr:glycosyltransferase [Stellaceae bacterium]
MTAATLLGAAAAAIWVYLILLRGGFWRIGPPPAGPAAPPPRAVVAIIPARDEAASIGAAVTSLLAQRHAGAFHLIVVDDHSSDGTADLARRAAAGAAERLTVVAAAPLPAGWTGKLWAMRQGIEAASRLAPDYLLLTDADIVHPPENLAELVARAEAGGWDLVSLMVRLNCRSQWERLLIPAFVFFFFKLYPPRRVADPKSRVAAAAGGCMLVRRAALDRIGGVDGIRGEIIDDCALARRLKAHGPIWLGAAPTGPEGAVRSLREYRSWRPIWDMIARCAFAQLGCSAPALVATVGLMGLIYIAPPVLVCVGPLPARLFGGAAWAMMSLAFLPVLRRYDGAPLRAPLLPLAALFYTAATIGSAIQYWRGRGGLWKGRAQAARAEG